MGNDEAAGPADATRAHRQLKRLDFDSGCCVLGVCSEWANPRGNYSPSPHLRSPRIIALTTSSSAATPSLRVGTVPPPAARLPVSQTLIFLLFGDPGTGKTTGTKLLGRSLHYAAARSSTAFVPTAAKELLNKTPADVHRVIVSAAGGELFVDEAY